MKVASIFFILWAAIQSHAGSIDSLKAELDGRWEWVETSGGYAGEIYTPQSEHYSLTLVFSKSAPLLESDSIGYQVYRNDSLILSGIAAIQGRSIKMPAFGPNNRIVTGVEKVTDTLFFGNSLILDGYSSIFARPKTSLKRDRPVARALASCLPSCSSIRQFTLSGRRINSSRHCMHPGQVIVSRRHAEIKGMGKK